MMFSRLVRGDRGGKGGFPNRDGVFWLSFSQCAFRKWQLTAWRRGHNCALRSLNAVSQGVAMFRQSNFQPSTAREGRRYKAETTARAAREEITTDTDKAPAIYYFAGSV